MKKYVKQWGATVGSTILDNGEEVWSVDITPQMQQDVLYKGQPKYSILDDSITDEEFEELLLTYDIPDLYSKETEEEEESLPPLE